MHETGDVETALQASNHHYLTIVIFHSLVITRAKISFLTTTKIYALSLTYHIYLLYMHLDLLRESDLLE